MAASATFALKAGMWFRRARLLIVSPDSRVNLARRQAETSLIPLFRFLASVRDAPLASSRCQEIAPEFPPGVRQRHFKSNTKQLQALRNRWLKKSPPATLAGGPRRY